MSLSRAYLPRLEPPPLTMLDYLAARFPHVARDRWSERFDSCRIVAQDGTILRADMPYTHGITLLYPREVPGELAPAERAVIVYRDCHILVADKPHGIPVTPAGDWVERSLLVQLRKTTGIDALSPAHRLDRDTAGLVLFCLQEETRSAYHALFAENRIRREYHAIAGSAPDGAGWRVENRLEHGEPWFRQQIVEGPANAITNIECVGGGPFSRFRLHPETGKKHQLRVHMASLGLPILGDTLYGPAGKCEEPLQLLAYRLSFEDPLSGTNLDFTSGQSLLG